MPKRCLKSVWNWSETPSYPPSQTHSPKWPFWEPSTQTNIWREQSTALFYHTCLTGNNKLTFFKFTLGFLISKTAVLEIKSRNKYWKRAVHTPILSYFITLSLGGISLLSLNLPSAVLENARNTYWKMAVGSSILSQYITLALQWQRISWRSLNFPWGFWCRKRPFWKSSARNKCWKRAVDAPIMSHFLRGKSLRSFNVSWRFWFAEALWGVWTNICFVLVDQDGIMKSVKLCQVNKWQQIQSWERTQKGFRFGNHFPLFCVVVYWGLLWHF